MVQVIDRVPDDNFGSAERNNNGAIEYVEEIEPEHTDEPFLGKIMDFFVPLSTRYECNGKALLGK